MAHPRPKLPAVVPVDAADPETVKLPYVVLVDHQGNQLQPLPENLEHGDLLAWDANTQRFERVAAPLDAVPAPQGGLTADTQARAAINDIRDRLAALGLISAG